MVHLHLDVLIKMEVCHGLDVLQPSKTQLGKHMFKAKEGGCIGGTLWGLFLWFKNSLAIEVSTFFSPVLDVAWLVAIGVPLCFGLWISGTVCLGP